MTPVDRALVATLAYFDVFAVPLTTLEVWRYLFWQEETAPPDLADVEAHLTALAAAQVVASAGPGFWRLPGGPAAADRLMREAEAVGKWRRLRFGARLLAGVPFLTGLAAVNTLTIGAAKPESDIDVLIIARPGRLFLVRLLAVFATSVFGLRRHGEHVRDRLCLSFFLSERALDMRPLAKTPDDPHLRAWAATLIVVLERDAIFRRFAEANRAWFSCHPHVSLRRLPAAPDPFPLLRGLRTLAEAVLSGRLGDWCEAGAKWLQMRRFVQNTDSRSALGTTDVVISDDVLKFHERDRRLEVRAAWQERCSRYAASA